MTKLAKLKESIFSIFKKNEIDVEDSLKKEMEAIFEELGSDNKSDEKVASALDKLSGIIEKLESGNDDKKDKGDDKPDESGKSDKEYKALLAKLEGLEKRLEDEKMSGQKSEFNKVFLAGEKEGKVAKGQMEELEKTFKGDPLLLEYHLKQIAKDRFIGGKPKDDKSDEQIKKETVKQEQDRRLSAYDPEIVKMAELKN